MFLKTRKGSEKSGLKSNKLSASPSAFFAHPLCLEGSSFINQGYSNEFNIIKCFLQVTGCDVCGSKRNDCFFAGDFRVNEQLNLIVLHTLFMREHNR